MKTALAIFALARVSLAQTVSSLPSKGVTCASDDYTEANVKAAAIKALKLWGEDQTVGSDEYPHTYHDYEGFTFSCGSPYIEFPIMSDGEVYTGGSPGADRVVVGKPASDGSTGTYCALITHTGANGDDFEECTNK